MAEDDLRFRITGDSSDLKDSLRSSGDQARSTTDALNDAGSAARETGSASSDAASSIDQLGSELDQGEQSAGLFGTSITKVQAAVVAFAAGLAALVSRAQEWVALSNVQERAETKLAATLQTLTGAGQEQVDMLKAQASALQDLTGYGDEQTISAQAMLGTFRLTAEEIAILTPRMLDMAEASRKAGSSQADLEGIALQLGRVFTSGIGSLGRYGVAMSDAQEEAFKLADQSERVRILAEILDGNFGGLAQTIGETFEGSLRKLEDAQGDLGEVLGDSITKNKDAQGAVDSLTGAFQEMGAGVKEAAPEIGQAVSFLANSIEVAFGGVKAVFNTVQILFKTTVLVVNSGIEAINRALATVTWGDWAKDFEEAANKIQLDNANLVDSIAGDVDDLGEAGRRITGAFDGQSQALGESASAATTAGAAQRGLAGDLGATATASGAAGSAQRGLAADMASVTGAADSQAQSLSGLNSALGTFGLDFEQLQTGLSKAERDIITSFDTVISDPRVSGEQIQTVFNAALSKISDDGAPALKQSLERAFEEGQIGADQLKAGLDAVDKKLADLAAKAEQAGKKIRDGLSGADGGTSQKSVRREGSSGQSEDVSSAALDAEKNPEQRKTIRNDRKKLIQEQADLSAALNKNQISREDFEYKYAEIDQQLLGNPLTDAKKESLRQRAKSFAGETNMDGLREQQDLRRQAQDAALPGTDVQGVLSVPAKVDAAKIRQDLEKDFASNPLSVAVKFKASGGDLGDAAEMVGD